jgi:hypothetical protein
MRKILTVALTVFIVGGMVFGKGKSEPAKEAAGGSELSKAVRKLTADSKWELVESIHLNFPLGHPQGLVKIGEAFYVSTVEVVTPARRYPELRDGYDRDTGAGKGFLHKFDGKGHLLGSVSVEKGSMYHPGGIDYDGSSIWVPVAEYRPNSASIIYKVDPATMTAQKVFEYKDHIGGIVHDTENNAIHGLSWGSRRFYRWPVNAQGEVGETETPRDRLMVLNPEHYIDYQDAHYIGNGEMLCSGLATYTYNGTDFPLGGIEIVDLKTNTPVHQIPVKLRSPKTGKSICQNPFWLELKDGIVTAYFVPDDDDATMYVYRETP